MNGGDLFGITTNSILYGSGKARTCYGGSAGSALIGPVPKQEMKVLGTTLFTDNIVALLPSTHPLANQKAIKLSQLREDSFVLFPKEYVLREIIVRACEQIGFQPKVSFEGVDTDSIKGLVSAGLGITLIPEITLVDGFPRSTVKIPIIEPEVTRTVGVIIPRERKMLPTVRLFYDFLKDFFSRLDRYQM
jgi:LysR family transcriptional regulator, transcription activator of glutamate synthase operon